MKKPVIYFKYDNSTKGWHLINIRAWREDNDLRHGKYYTMIENIKIYKSTDHERFDYSKIRIEHGHDSHIEYRHLTNREELVEEHKKNEVYSYKEITKEEYLSTRSRIMELFNNECLDLEDKKSPHPKA